MPLFQELLNLDQVFHNSQTEPIIVNDLCSKTEDDRDYFNNLVKQTFTSDVISVMPRCQCGELKGEYRSGEVCDICGTPVKQSIENDINPTVWFRRPSSVEKLINPIVFIMLNQRFTKSKFKVIQWLIDKNYGTGIKRPPSVEQLVQMQIPRGYNSFVQNFDGIMEFLFNHDDFTIKRATVGFLVGMLDFPEGTIDPLKELIRVNRDKLFSDYIPILNRSLFVLDLHATGKYLDPTTIDIKDALNTMLSIDQDYYDKTPAVIENRTAKILIMLTDYYETLLQKNISAKEGLTRQHGYGTRSNLAFRAVITSHEAIHDHDEIWVPWCVGLTTFQLLVLNRLMNEKLPYGGMTHNEAIGFIYQHIYKYHPLLDEILKDIVANFPGGSIKCLNQRNYLSVSFSRKAVDKTF